MKKTIQIKKNESKKSYLSDIKKISQIPPKEASIRKSIIINQTLDEQIKNYIYKKRTQGDIYYTQTRLITEALNSFFKS